MVAEPPVPLIGLPYSCVTGPWWLVSIAHEVGHQVAYVIDALEGRPRIAEFIAAAAGEAGAEPELQQRWRSWSHEIFADAFAGMTRHCSSAWGWCLPMRCPRHRRDCPWRT